MLLRKYSCCPKGKRGLQGVVDVRKTNPLLQNISLRGHSELWGDVGDVVKERTRGYKVVQARIEEFYTHEGKEKGNR